MSLANSCCHRRRSLDPLMEAAVLHSCDATGAKKVQHKEKCIERREGTNTEDKGPCANVCFTAPQPVGCCWQDVRQMTAHAWSFGAIARRISSAVRDESPQSEQGADPISIYTIELARGQSWVNNRCVCVPGGEAGGGRRGLRDFFAVCNKTGPLSPPQPTGDHVCLPRRDKRGRKKFHFLQHLVKKGEKSHNRIFVLSLRCASKKTCLWQVCSLKAWFLIASWTKEWRRHLREPKISDCIFPPS